MNAPISSSHLDLWMVAGWTMIHFLWLGTLVAVAGLISRWVLCRASASVRYAVALSWLATLLALPIGIATWLYQNPPSVQVQNQPPRNESHALPAVAPTSRRPELNESTTIAVSIPKISSVPLVTPNDSPKTV